MKNRWKKIGASPARGVTPMRTILHREIEIRRELSFRQIFPSFAAPITHPSEKFCGFADLFETNRNSTTRIFAISISQGGFWNKFRISHLEERSHIDVRNFVLYDLSANMRFDESNFVENFLGAPSGVFFRVRAILEQMDNCDIF